VTVSEALADGIRALEATSDSPRADAQLLLAHVLHQHKEWLISHGDVPLAVSQRDAFRAACGVRAGGKPVAYILGTAWFHGHEFVVDEDVLIPRPETEHLVDDAIERLKTLPAPAMLDVGTGSGAIACTIAAEVPRVTIDATDISHEALNVARENARRLDVDTRVHFFWGDLTTPLGRERRYDVVVANLPYVPTGDIAPAPSPVSFEPRLALDGGADGLDAYRRLLPSLPERLSPEALVLLEAAPPVMKGLEELAREAFPDADVSVRNDYGGRERYVCVSERRRQAGLA
jgi:release factor glutamine methyltransferase